MRDEAHLKDPKPALSSDYACGNGFAIGFVKCERGMILNGCAEMPRTSRATWRSRWIKMRAVVADFYGRW